MANHPEPPTVSSTAREIFLRVLETDDLEGRDTLIDSACGDDDSVRSEVESLLRENEAIGDFLQGPAVVSQREPPKVSLPSREAEVKESRGDTIGPFKLLEPLGEGGCGMVYAAEQSTPVKRTVALKIIKLGMDTKSVIARFETERQALAMMDHPNIAKVFDAGATETGRPYFVMELVRGVPITTYCDREKLSTKQRLELFVQACNAIQHAHQKGIIHRDIKPSNILIGDHDGSPAPKVIDFGIAKATEQRLTEHTLDTAVEAFIGTPTYMSPEQAEVGGTDIDTRSDIYSLGILLYELLVGQPPFDAAGLQQLPIDEIRRTIRECEAERPSQKLGSLPESEIDRIAECRSCEPSKLAGKLRGDLDWIVIKCLEKDRSRRYATANALVYDIGRHLNSQPVLARPPSTLYRLKKLVRRHAAAITAGALLFATLVAGIAISWNHALRATRAERVAQEEKAKQGELAAQAVASAVAASLNEYVADINLAQLALSEGNFGRARQLLDKHLPISGEIDHRGFEWYYLSNLSRGDDHIALGDQRSSVQCLAYSPDGRTLAIGLRDEVRLWDVRAGRRITSLPGGATSLVFLPDGHTLASADRDTTWVVDTATWLEVIELRGHGAPIALSADGSQLATTSAGGIRVWDTTDWFELIHLREALPGPRAFSPDGKSLAARGSRGITLFSLATGRAALTLEDSAELLDARATGTLTFSADGSQIIAPRNTNSERGVFVMSTWDARTGRETGVLQNEFGHTANINQLGVHLGTNLLASASLDHSIGLWSLRDNALLTRLRGHRSEVWCVALSPDGSTVASGSKDGDLFLWPTSPQRPRDIIRDSLIPLAFSENGDRIATLDTNSKMTIFGLPSLIPLRSLSAAPLASTTPRSQGPRLRRRWLRRHRKHRHARVENRHGFRSRTQHPHVDSRWKIDADRRPPPTLEVVGSGTDCWAGQGTRRASREHLCGRRGLRGLRGRRSDRDLGRRSAAADQVAESCATIRFHRLALAGREVASDHGGIFRF